MKIMDLVRRDSLSLKHRQSCVGKNALMRLPPRPILARHVAVIRRRCSPRQSVPLLVRTHAVKSAAARQLPFEVINTRKLHIRPRWLIVISIFIEPRDRIWTRSAVRRLVVLRNCCGTTLRLSLSLSRHPSQGSPSRSRDPEFEPAPACEPIDIPIHQSHEYLPFSLNFPDRQSNTPTES